MKSLEIANELYDDVKELCDYYIAERWNEKKEIFSIKVNNAMFDLIKSIQKDKQDLERLQKQDDDIKSGELSDGYHTFNDLYYQRCILFATLVNQNKKISWKSYKHEDGELCFGGGWFIVGIDTPQGSYTYHYENKYWDLFQCKELECGKHWDGHTSKDVDRLLSIKNEGLEVLEIIRKKKVDVRLLTIYIFIPSSDEEKLKNYNKHCKHVNHELTMEELLKLKQWLEANE